MATTKADQIGADTFPVLSDLRAARCDTPPLPSQTSLGEGRGPLSDQERKALSPDPIGDQLDAAFRAAEGYSTMASSFHPELRERVAALVSTPRVFPDVDLYADQLPEALVPIHRELAVRAATDSPGNYLVWARYPDVNWPIPVGYSPPLIARWMILRYGGDCDWCDRGDATDGLLVSAGCAIALLSFCKLCRYVLSEECKADLAWI